MPRLSDKQLRSLLSIANLDPGFSCQGTSGQFLDAWIVAETIAKRLITFRSGKEIGNTWKWTEVEASIKHFKLSIPNGLETKRIFAGGPGKKIDRTPRQLRNAFIHGLSEETLEEMNSKGTAFADLLVEWRVAVTRG